MATYQHGIIGPFSGKIGPVVGSSWNGITYMKTRMRKRTKASWSPEQLNQQNNFRIMTKFLYIMQKVLEYGFDNQIKTISKFSKAMSYALKNALNTDTIPSTINYSKILLTKGKYPAAAGLTASSGKMGTILFNWMDNSGVGAARANDRVVLLAYSPREKMMIHDNNFVRSAVSGELIAKEFIGDTLETYVVFRKADGSDVSSSVYTGQVVVIF